MATSSMALIAMLAHVATEEILVNQMQEKLKDIQNAILLNKPKTEVIELFKDLAPLCMMIMIKIQGDDPIKLLDDMDKLESARKILDPDKQ